MLAERKPARAPRSQRSHFEWFNNLRERLVSSTSRDLTDVAETLHSMRDIKDGEGGFEVNMRHTKRHGYRRIISTRFTEKEIAHAPDQIRPDLDVLKHSDGSGLQAEVYLSSVTSENPFGFILELKPGAKQKQGVCLRMYVVATVGEDWDPAIVLNLYYDLEKRELVKSHFGEKTLAFTNESPELVDFLRLSVEWIENIVEDRRGIFD